MKVIQFISKSLPAALSKINEQLGPEAVVLSVRPLPRQGIARFWSASPSLEVLACVAEAGEEGLGQCFDTLQSARSSSVSGSPLLAAFSQGLPPLFGGSKRPHVFIGPPGVGKTTLLCKWMTRSVLQENRTVKVWRLDAANANTSESLNVYAEMLEVPVERFWAPPNSAVDSNGHTQLPAAFDLLLVDVPGVPLDEPQALDGLHSILAGLPNPRVHLVLNAAYDTSVLREQLQAFARFAPEDLSFCHLDESRCLDRLQELLTGTNCRLRFLSTGQKIPGDLQAADPSAALRSKLAA